MSDLLELNPDRLFQQHTVSEIEQVSKKLQDEIEIKKEDLRTMVGERYRDLLKAADTINDMKATANLVVQRIESILEHSGRVTENLKKYGKDTQTSDKNQIIQARSKYYGVVVQIHILTLLPEMIWTHLHHDEYFVAAQLFAFSRHMSTDLQLNDNTAVIYFPVARRQWTVLRPFLEIIRDHCFTTLGREILPASVASKCLASLLLLESSNIDTLLTVFIELRLKAFLNILAEDEEDKSRKVKDKILTSLRLVMESSEIIFKCFVGKEGTEGLIMEEIKDLEGKEPTISLIKFDNSEIMGVLPGIISQFKPQVAAKTITSESVASFSRAWLEKLSLATKTALKSLIDLIPSVKVIHDIKRQAMAMKKPEDWEIICERLFLPKGFAAYEYFYQDLLNERVKHIIESSWDATLEAIQKDVEKLAENADKSAKSIGKMIWIEESSDIPQSLQQAISQDQKTHKLLMKTKGYTPAIVAVCENLDKRLELLFNDISNYVSRDSDADKHLKALPEVVTDTLTEFLVQCSTERILKFVAFLRSGRLGAEGNFINLAKLLQAFAELCPYLKNCLSRRNSNSEDDDLEKWKQMCQRLEEESLHFWNLWLISFLKDTQSKSSSTQATNLNVILQEFSNWETITLEEKNEQEVVLKSSIRVPSQPSLSLQQKLFNLCRDLNQVGSHTIPRIILNRLVENVITQLFDFYRIQLENEMIQTNQNCCIQYYFDVKFISLVLVARENKGLTEKGQSLSQNFKSRVDPFDFEMSYDYINANVKRAAHRVLHQLGCIVPNMDYLVAMLGNRQTPTSQEKEPNILAISGAGTSDPVSWFPLLPIISSNTATAAKVPTSTSTSIEKSSTTPEKSRKYDDSRQSSSVVSTTQNYASNVKSGAAAFFGVMSQDWFKS
ncbi:conserved oligomeric Golgi complex subunit 1 [Lutzomyia longipalpis]|uniref:conserved oligomeric Golgi complex subunit 1 n=1 Tax=Lutzomyia longipalpis TaxID=7200 RepID=UPI00248370F5|nr:conserved oligomeric Golgi complex subunit 1 [Lutzomyia longipalpis]XP_055679196.1 conserved oligomeric Golgi complex subunit 1 [Lutzomyia longipalpis]